MLGGCLFADKSNNLIHLMFLSLLAYFETVGYYSWGSTDLALLYRELCRVSRIHVHQITEPLILLQVWVWDRFSFIAPRKLERPLVDPIMDLADGVALPHGPVATRYVSNIAYKHLFTDALLIKM